MDIIRKIARNKFETILKQYSTNVCDNANVDIFDYELFCLFVHVLKIYQRQNVIGQNTIRKYVHVIVIEESLLSAVL